MLDLTKEDALIHPEQVTCAPDHSGCADDPPPHFVLECSAQDQELTDEAIEQRQSNRRENDK